MIKENFHMLFFYLDIMYPKHWHTPTLYHIHPEILASLPIVRCFCQKTIW